MNKKKLLIITAGIVLASVFAVLLFPYVRALTIPGDKRDYIERAYEFCEKYTYRKLNCTPEEREEMTEILSAVVNDDYIEKSRAINKLPEIVYDPMVPDAADEDEKQVGYYSKYASSYDEISKKDEFRLQATSVYMRLLLESGDYERYVNEFPDAFLKFTASVVSGYYYSALVAFPGEFNDKKYDAFLRGFDELKKRVIEPSDIYKCVGNQTAATMYAYGTDSDKLPDYISQQAKETLPSYGASFSYFSLALPFLWDGLTEKSDVVFITVISVLLLIVAVLLASCMPRAKRSLEGALPNKYWLKKYLLDMLRDTAFAFGIMALFGIYAVITKQFELKYSDISFTIITAVAELLAFCLVLSYIINLTLAYVRDKTGKPPKRGLLERLEVKKTSDDNQ